VLPSEPEEEQAVAEQEQQADSLDERHESMQIEEVSQQTAPPAQQGKQDTAGSGMVQSVMGAAKSFFGGGKSDEQVGVLLLPFTQPCWLLSRHFVYGREKDESVRRCL